MAGSGLLALAAIGAVTAATAAAAPPEFGRCVPAAVPKTGQYMGKNCVVPSPGNKGKYDFLPAPGPAPAFSGLGEKVSLETPGKAVITCAAATFEGSYTGPKTETVTLDLVGCILSSSPSQQKCQTTPVKEGEIEAQLEGELGFISGGSKPVVGLDLKPKAPSTTFATFQCGKLPETGPSGTIEGSVIAPISPKNHMVEEFKLKYLQSGGKQAVEHFEGGPNDTLTVKLLSGVELKTEPIGLKTIVVDSNEEPLEIKAN